MNIVLGIILGIIVLTVVVTAHEFGHFLVARRNGVKVNEFGIGFPPKAIAWLHVPASKAVDYARKFKLSNRQILRIKARVGKIKQKQAEAEKGQIAKSLKNKKSKKVKEKYIWIRFPKSEWYKEENGELALNTQEYLIFSLNYLPIGGFCQMDGESDIDEREGTFGAASFWSKTKILFAGVGMNWILAFVIFTILTWVGMPEMIENQFKIKEDAKPANVSRVIIAKTEKDSPADKAGLEPNDIVLSGVDKNGDETEFKFTSDIQDFDDKNAGKKVSFNICRLDDGESFDNTEDCPEDDKLATDEVQLNSKDDKYILGVAMQSTGISSFRATWSAPIVGIGTTIQVTGETFKGLGVLVYDLFSGVGSRFSQNAEVREAGQAKLQEASNSVSGPIGIVGILFPTVAQTGIANVLYIVALISVSLACMNVLPIPALDGGRWFLIALFKLLRKPLTAETEGKIVSRAFVVLLIIAVIVSVLDITKIVG